jgi:flagellar hook-length control protein FliK
MEPDESPETSPVGENASDNELPATRLLSRTGLGDSRTGGQPESRETSGGSTPSAQRPEAESPTPELSGNADDQPLFLKPDIAATAGPRSHHRELAARGTLSLESPVWATELSERIGQLHREQHSHMVLELEPKDLGRLVLRVEAEQNQVNATIAADSDQVRGLLLHNSADLKGLLLEQGLMLGQFTVDVRDRRGDSFVLAQPRGTRRISRTPARASEGNRAGLSAASLVHRGNSRQLIHLIA